MNKVLGIILKVLFIIFLLLLCVALFLFIRLWFDFFDVTGLALYNNKPIEKVYTVHDYTYIVTDDNEVFVMGGAAGSGRTGNRKYENSATYSHEKWGCQTPVKCFEGEIKTIFQPGAYFYNGAFIITKNDDLYILENVLDARKIAESVITASKYNDATFILHTDHALTKLDGEIETKLIDGIYDFAMVGNHIFVILENGDLCKLERDGNENFVLSEVIMKNAVSIKMEFSSTAVKFDPDEPDLVGEVITNVLLSDGTLYAKGTYSYVFSEVTYGDKMQSELSEDWTVIGTDVTEYALSCTGTLMKTNGGELIYHGFNTRQDADPIKLDRMTVKIENAKCICVEEGFVAVSDENYLYVWGDRYFAPYLCDVNRSLDIFYNNPYPIKLK